MPSKNYLNNARWVSAFIALIVGAVVVGLFPRCDQVVTKAEMKEAIAKDTDLTKMEMRYIREDVREIKTDLKEILEYLKTKGK